MTKPSPDDIALFRAALQDTRPLPDSGRVVPVQARPAVMVRRRTDSRADGVADVLLDSIAEPEADDRGFARVGLRRDTLRRLRRGHWGVQAELDLHGLARDAARLEVARFLDHCVRQQMRSVRIVSGKGSGSPDGMGILRRMLPAWLSQRDEVLAFCAARQADGGTGALMLLLKLSKPI